jgi:hypothetical protein
MLVVLRGPQHSGPTYVSRDSTDCMYSVALWTDEVSIPFDSWETFEKV